MNDLSNRLASIQTIMDQPLSNKVKVMRSLEKFSGLVVSDLSRQLRDKLESALVNVNQIVVLHNGVKGADDFGKVNKKDLKRIITILNELCCDLSRILIAEMI